ncbi:MAG: DegQ family serine endoprotease [Methylococcales bacterium]|nr:DegQ family serine endoprotease [Methylococcales bacterium]
MLRNIVWLFFTLVVSSTAVYAQLPDFTVMVKEQGDAVVNISTTQKASEITQKFEGQQLPEGLPPEMEELFRHFFKQPGRGFQPKDVRSLGSGFIISKNGYVLTNHHVVKDADEIIVKLKDRRQLVAKLIGSDERTDVALLKIDADDLPVVKQGSSEKLLVGEWVLAIGSPFGFEQSVTAGIVSAKGRSLPGGNYVPFIQTDVAINPGNSGGPLFNMKGEVVGVNSQIYSRSGGYMGLSFAIPMDVAMNVVKQIKTKGSVSRGWLGVQIQDVTRELAESFNMDKPYGALVAKVISASPAEKAGLKIGDVIVEFNGHKINSSGELPPIVGITNVGEKIKVKVIREGRSKTIKVVVGLLAEDVSLAAVDSAKKSFNRLGIVVINLTTEQRKQLDLPKNGVLVQSVNKGSALDAGIQKGDVILRIQNNIVRDTSNFDKILKKLPADQSIAVLIQRRGSPVFLALKIK